MKRPTVFSVIILFLWGIVLMCFACQENEQPQGVTYNPQPKSSVMSDEQRQAAIAQKRKELNMLLTPAEYKNAVKLTIRVPKITEDFTMQSAEVMATRMLQITAENGVAGYGGDPSFVFAGVITSTRKGITSTIPKKNYVAYNISFYIANILTGDVFGCFSQDVTGVGNTDESASVNAILSIENNNDIQVFINETSKKIISWYEANKATVISQISRQVQLEEYDKAYALLQSIPRDAKTCFAAAQKYLDEVYDKFSTDYYYVMLDAMAVSDKYNPEAGAYMRLISPKSSVYAKADSTFNSYVMHCIDVEDAKRAHEMFMENENLAIERINAETNLKASEALVIHNQMEAQRQTAELEGQNKSNKRNINDIMDKTVTIFTSGVKILGVLGLLI